MTRCLCFYEIGVGVSSLLYASFSIALYEVKMRYDYGFMTARGAPSDDMCLLAAGMAAWDGKLVNSMGSSAGYGVLR
jgi:hypothetical protein